MIKKDIEMASARQAHPQRFVRGFPEPPPLPEAACVNKSKTKSNKTTLAGNMTFQGVAVPGQGTDRPSWSIIESNFLNQDGKTDENDTKSETEVSHLY